LGMCNGAAISQTLRRRQSPEMSARGRIFA
jgi:hypothetical protein